MIGFYKIGSCKVFAKDWLQTGILLISASWIARITGVSHQDLSQIHHLYNTVSAPGSIQHYTVSSGLPLSLCDIFQTARLLCDTSVNSQNWQLMLQSHLFNHSITTTFSRLSSPNYVPFIYPFLIILNISHFWTCPSLSNWLGFSHCYFLCMECPSLFSASKYSHPLMEAQAQCHLSKMLFQPYLLIFFLRTYHTWNIHIPFYSLSSQKTRKCLIHLCTPCTQPNTWLVIDLDKYLHSGHLCV
jgi:hypothetical protein